MTYIHPLSDVDTSRRTAFSPRNAPPQSRPPEPTARVTGTPQQTSSTSIRPAIAPDPDPAHTGRSHHSRPNSPNEPEPRQLADKGSSARYPLCPDSW